MKKLSMEEKAKRYDEAIKTTRKWYDANTNEGYRGIFEDIFPELKESEDERVRKAMIHFFFNTENTSFEYWEGIPKSKVIAWLEKQGEQKPAFKMMTPEESLGIDSDTYNKIVDDCLWGEQKPADKVEPKFKVGDWILIEEVKGYKRGPFQIKTVDSFGYSFDEYHTIPFMYEDLLSKWTIQDARDGDVLEFGDHGRLVVGIVSYVNKITGKVDVSCLLEGDKFKVGVFYNLDTVKPHPATKEQRDLLFKKMKEAGYEWDSEKKELKEIEQKSTPMSLDEAIEHCKEKSCGNNACALEHKQLEKWLIELKELKEQKPATWSEEDKRILSGLSRLVKDCYLNGGYALPTDEYDEYKKWLKSLRPQNMWKPSDEQMEALASALSLAKNCGEESAFDLRTLHEQLKKLREE